METLDFLGERYSNEKDLNEYQINKIKWLTDGDYSDSSKKTYFNLMNRNVNYLEISKHKDLFNFSKEEIIELLQSIPTTNRNTKVVFFSMISMYINWAIEKGWLQTGINNCDLINSSEENIFRVNIKAVQRAYQTLEEFYDFINNLKGAFSDKAVLLLSRYGVTINDMGMVRFDNIDEKNMTLMVETDNRNLYLPIDQDFIDYIADIYSETEYEIGDKILKYENHGYVLKANNKTKNIILNSSTLYNKVNTISKNNEIKRIKIAQLSMNRKFDILFSILDEKGEINIEDIECVLEVFDGEVTATKKQTLKNAFELVSGEKVSVSRNKKMS